MSETPFARKLGTAPISKGKKYAQTLRCLLFVVAFALATLALTTLTYAQPSRTYTGGPITSVTFETQAEFDAAKAAATGDAAAEFTGLEWVEYNENSLLAIDRVVEYFNDIIDVAANGRGPSVHFRHRITDAAAYAGGNTITWAGTSNANTPDRNTQLIYVNGFENTTLHEMGHVMGIGSGTIRPGNWTVTGEGAAATVTFSSVFAHARVFNTTSNAWEAVATGTPYSQGTDFGYFGALTSEVFGDTWTGGTPEVVRVIDDLTLGEGATFSHPDEPDRSVMSYDGNRRSFFTETELTMYAEAGGNTLQVDRFFGRSLNQIHAQPINLTTANNSDFSFNGINGWQGDGMWGVGLHLVQNYVDQPMPGEAAYGTAEGNEVSIQTHLVSTGELGTGIRFEGANNTVTIEENVIIGATGVDGIGVVFAQDSTGSVLNIKGAIDAQQTDGTLNLIFGKHANVGDEDYTINIDGNVKLAGRFDLGDGYTLTIADGNGISAAAMTQVAEGIWGEGRLEIAAGTFEMLDGSILQVGVGRNNAADLITITENATADLGDFRIALLNTTPIEGTYTVIEWADGTLTHEESTPGFIGMSTPGRKGGDWEGTSSWLDNALTINIWRGDGTADTTHNFFLTWQGQVYQPETDPVTGESVDAWVPNNVWQEGEGTNENWKDQFNAEVWFKNSDSIRFDLSGDQIVNVGEYGNETRTVSDMLVVGDGNWIIDGNIVGDNSNADFYVEEVDDPSNPGQMIPGPQPNTLGMLQVGDSAGEEIFTGTLTFDGDANFVGGATVWSGTLQIGNGGAAGTFSGDIRLNSTRYTGENNAVETLYSQLIFNSSGYHDYLDNISGVGSLTKKGSGILAMGGAVTHTGTTTVEEGMLEVNYLVGTSALDVQTGAFFGGIFPDTSQTIVRGNIKNSGTIAGLALLRGKQISNEMGASILNVGTIDVSFSTGQFDLVGDNYIYNPADGDYAVTPRSAYDETTETYTGNFDMNPDGTGYVPNTDGNGRFYIETGDVTSSVTTYGDFTNAFGASVSYVDEMNAKNVRNAGVMVGLDTMTVQSDLINTTGAVIGDVSSMNVAKNFTSTGMTGNVETLMVGNILNNTGLLANIETIHAAHFQNQFGGVVAGVGTITMAETPSEVPGVLPIVRRTFENFGTIALGELDYEALITDNEIAYTGARTLTIDGNFESTSGTFVVSLGQEVDTNEAFINVVNGNAVINGGTVDIMIADNMGTNFDNMGMNFLADKEFALISVERGVDLANPYRLIVDPNAPLIAGDISDPLFSEFFDVVLGYDEQSYNLSFTRSNTYSVIGKTMNQRAIGKYIDTATIYPSGDFRNVLLALKDARAGAVEQMQQDSSYTFSSDPVEACLAQMAGSIYGTETASSFRNTVMVHTTLANVLRRDYNHISAATDAYLSGGMMRLPSDNLWGMIYGHAGSSQFDGNTSGYRQGFSGIMAGFDRKNDARNRFGFFLSMGDGSLSSDLNDRSLSKELMLGHYFRKDTDSTYMLLQAGFGTHRYDTRRLMAFGSLEPGNHHINRTALNEHSSFLVTGHFETGLKYRGGIFNLSPYVGLEYTGLLREGFTEYNAGSLNLTAEREDYHVIRPMFGLRFDSAPFRFQKALASFYGNVAWMYEFEANERPSQFQAQFTEAGVFSGSTFTVHGNDPGRDWVQAGFGLNTDLNANLRVFAGYDAYANSQQVLHSANLGFMLQR